MKANTRIKIRNFFKRYGKIILIVLGVWAVLLVINYIFGHMPKQEVPITTYEPHKAVMDDSEVPKQYQDPIEDIIKNFMDACNAKDYDKAYSMLSKECQENVYPNKRDFEMYVDSVFDQKKIYNIQNFSNKDDYYIYDVTILNDIMASGLTNEELETYEESFVIKNENGNLKLSIRGYIGNNKVDQMYEDEYLKITIDEVKINYETMTYSVKIRNKTDDVVVIEDFSEKNEVILNTDWGERKPYGLFIEPIVVRTGETKVFEITFTRYYDEVGDVNSIDFRNVRILKSYTGTEETRQEELDNATKIYSFSLDLK